MEELDARLPISWLHEHFQAVLFFKQGQQLICNPVQVVSTMGEVDVVFEARVCLPAGNLVDLSKKSYWWLKSDTSEKAHKKSPT